MKVRLAQQPRTAFPRRLLQDASVIIALLLVGGLCGIGARRWIGGLGAQHARLEQCIVATRQSHSDEDARSTLAHLDADVPRCMNAAGYERALDNPRCSPAYWQGDVFCYLPKSSLGKLIYRSEAASAGKKMDDQRDRTPREGG